MQFVLFEMIRRANKLKSSRFEIRIQRKVLIEFKYEPLEALVQKCNLFVTISSEMIKTSTV